MDLTNSNSRPILDQKPSHIKCKCQKYKKLALNSGIQTYKILANDDEVCIPSVSSIHLAVNRKTTVVFGKEGN